MFLAWPSDSLLCSKRSSAIAAAHFFDALLDTLNKKDIHSENGVWNKTKQFQLKIITHVMCTTFQPILFATASSHSLMTLPLQDVALPSFSK
jgi:hypothetical protein